jgi:hypothetical protein
MRAERWKVFFLSAQDSDHSFASLAQILDRLGKEMVGDGTTFPSVQTPAEFRERLSSPSIFGVKASLSRSLL